MNKIMNERGDITTDLMEIKTDLWVTAMKNCMPGHNIWNLYKKLITYMKWRDTLKDAKCQTEKTIK